MGLGLHNLPPRCVYEHWPFFVRYGSLHFPCTLYRSSPPPNTAYTWTLHHTIYKSHRSQGGTASMHGLYNQGAVCVWMCRLYRASPKAAQCKEISDNVQLSFCLGVAASKRGVKKENRRGTNDTNSMTRTEIKFPSSHKVLQCKVTTRWIQVWPSFTFIFHQVESNMT